VGGRRPDAPMGGPAVRYRSVIPVQNCHRLIRSCHRSSYRFPRNFSDRRLSKGGIRFAPDGWARTAETRSVAAPCKAPGCNTCCVGAYLQHAQELGSTRRANYNYVGRAPPGARRCFDAEQNLTRPAETGKASNCAQDAQSRRRGHCTGRLLPRPGVESAQRGRRHYPGRPRGRDERDCVPGPGPEAAPNGYRAAVFRSAERSPRRLPHRCRRFRYLAPPQPRGAPAQAHEQGHRVHATRGAGSPEQRCSSRTSRASSSSRNASGSAIGWPHWVRWPRQSPTRSRILSPASR
jgi:hypothetical protein